MARRKKDYVLVRENQTDLNYDYELEKFTNSSQFMTIMSFVRKGAAFVVLGSDNSPRREVQKALCDAMKVPVNNGIACYDAKVAFLYAQERTVYMISVNDWGNATGNYISRIVRLGVNVNVTVYANNFLTDNTVDKAIPTAIVNTIIKHSDINAQSLNGSKLCLDYLTKCYINAKFRDCDELIAYINTLRIDDIKHLSQQMETLALSEVHNFIPFKKSGPRYHLTQSCYKRGVDLWDVAIKKLFLP